MGCVPGVYVLKFKGRAGEVAYVGASFAVRRRVRHHLDQLKQGCHPNRRLRIAWALLERRRVKLSIHVRELPAVVDAGELRAFEQRLVDHWVLRVGWDRLLNHQQDVRAIHLPAVRA